MQGASERQKWISYAFELRDTLDAALVRLDALKVVAREWVANGELWLREEDGGVELLAELDVRFQNRLTILR